MTRVRMTCPSEVKLDPWERSLAIVVGGNRQAFSSANGDKDPKKTPSNPYQIHIEGVGGELAFAKLRNLYPILNFLPTSGGHDLMDKQGKSFDVKTTSRVDGRLLVSLHKDQDPSDFYVLMIGDLISGNYVCKGYAAKESLFKECNKKHCGHGMVYALDQEHLTPLK